MNSLNQPWAITKTALLEMAQTYAANLPLSEDALQAAAKLTDSRQSVQLAYEIRSGVAVLDVSGPLMKSPDIIDRLFFGATAYSDISLMMDSAVADEKISAIVLNIDSRGGTVDGCFECADQIFQSRAKKPVIAYADGMMASAAYALGSAATAIYAPTAETTQVGSIGVIQTHIDISRALNNAGIEVSHIYAGKYKTVGTPYKPLSEDDKAVMQAEIDHLYTVFVNNVARNRGVDTKTVLSDMADARIFIGKQAVDAGLVDGLASFADIINALSAGELPGGKPLNKKRTATAVAANIINAPETKHELKKKGKITMDMQTLKADHPELYNQVKAEGRKETEAELKPLIAAAREEGAKAETERVKGVLSKMDLAPGHSKMVVDLAVDGKTTGPEAAEKVLEAEASERKAAAESLKDDGGAGNVPDAEEGTMTAEGKTEPGPDATVEERAEAAWGSDEKLRAEFGNDKAAYVAFAKAEAAGQVKIKGYGN